MTTLPHPHPHPLGRIKQLFNEVCDLPDALSQRAALQAQGVEPDVLEEVMRLLGHADADTHFAIPVAAATQHWLGSELKAGDRIGAWTLTGPLGQGGMGRVFMAARSDGHYEQRAAIKLLLGWSGPEALARLARERQILANLNHPNIAQLIDGGTTPGGQPFLVMEFAEGQAIDAYCAANRLTLEARLELFQKVCDAVAHAHRHLVIHCDIKPSNVLVSADGRVKLLDFGIARLEGQDKDGVPAMTPGYASPEQLAGQALGVATDVYSLGRLLDELLKPLALAQRRRVELAAVVSLATAEVAGQRYPAVATLQRDLRYLLANQPLVAMPPSALYSLRSLLRRRWPWALAGGAVLALSAAFTVGLIMQRDRALLAEEQTRQVARRALFSEQVAREAEFQSGQGSQRARLSAQVARDAESQARQSETLARRAAHESSLDLARAQAAEAEAIRQRDLAHASDVQTVECRDLAMQGGRRAAIDADACRHTSRLLMSLFTGADPQLTDVPAVPKSLVVAKGRELLAREMSSNPDARARLQLALGDIYERVGRFDDAIASFSEAAKTVGTAAAERPLAQADALRRLALAYETSGQVELAEEPARHALALREKHDPWNLSDRADAEDSLGTVLTQLHRYPEAGQHIEQALQLRIKDNGPDDPMAVHAQRNVARWNRSRGQPALAESQLDTLIAIERRTIGPLDVRTLRALQDRGLALSDLQRHGDAERSLREAVQGWTTVLGANSADVASARHDLGRALREAGRFDAAMLELSAALGIESPPGAALSIRAAAIHMSIAGTQEAAGHLALAEEAWRIALARLQQGLGVPALTLAAAQHGLARTLWLALQPQAALRALAPALATRNQRLALDDDQRLQSRILAAELTLIADPGAPAPANPLRFGDVLAQIDDIAALMAEGPRVLQFDLLALRGHAEMQRARPLEAAQWLSQAWQGELAWRGYAPVHLLPLGLALRAALHASGQDDAALALWPALEACASAAAPDSVWRERMVQTTRTR